MPVYPKPGNTVPMTGIYLVTHFPEHKKPHEVKYAKGKIFPSCEKCKETIYAFVRGK